MANLLKLHKVWFGFQSYKSGLKLHLGLFAFYSLLFIGVYGLLQYQIDNKDARFYEQLWLSRYLVLTMILHLCCLLILRRRQTQLFARDYFLEKGSAYNLALFRIFFFFTLAGHFTFYTFQKEISWTYLPDSSRVALPYIGWLVEHMPINPTLYTICSVLAAIFSFLICIGLFTRFAQLLLLPFAFYLLAVPLFYGKLNHHHILLWIPILFCFAPVGDVWSVDAWIKKKPIEPGIKYMLSFKLLWLQLAIIYVFAGLIKLWDCGLDWALSDNMVNQMRWEWVEHYDKVPGFRLDNYSLLARISGLCVIWFELLYFLLPLRPSTRLWACIGAFALHLLSGYFMYIDFVTLRLIALCYIDWHGLINKIGIKLKYDAPIINTPLIRPFSLILREEHIRKAFITGTALLSLNFLCSVFSIHSYPFSSYPTYSSLVSDRISVIRMEVTGNDGEKVNIKELGRQHHFRWETIRPYEIRIATAFEQNDSLLLNSKLQEYWLLWKNNVKGLNEVKRITFYLDKTPTKPEERKTVLSSDSLGTIALENEE